MSTKKAQNILVEYLKGLNVFGVPAEQFFIDSGSESGMTMNNEIPHQVRDDKGLWIATATSCLAMTYIKKSREKNLCSFIYSNCGIRSGMKSRYL